MLRFHPRNTAQSAWRSGLKYFSSVLKVSEEVAEALHAGKPVVALESAIVTHGMPRPVNLRTALQVESIVRENGATPATVAVLNGTIRVGLSAKQTEELAADRSDLVKVSRRDFPYVIAQKLSGGTTVSGTMIAAHKTGIPIFVTGGIGGVHRGAEEDFDVSADLTELGRTPVTVVCAGVKSILDIPKTLEYLETEGVGVITYGKTKDFPAFFTPSSGYFSPCAVNDPVQAAQIIFAGEEVGLDSGRLIAVPIPEEFSSSGEIIESAIQQAVAEAREKNITGKEVTPYILERVNQLTDGASLTAIVKNNAAVGSQIAVELNRLKHHGSSSPLRSSHSGPSVASANRDRQSRSANDSSGGGRPVVVGGLAVDFMSRIGSPNFKPDGATYPGQVYQSFGGVGRNLADGLTRLGHKTLFISVAGEDTPAEAFFSSCKHMDTSGISVLPGERTATYSAVLKSTGELLFGIGDMSIHRLVTADLVSKFESEISEAPIVCLDANIGPDVIAHVCDICSFHKVPVWYEPTDINKATKAFQTSAGSTLTYTSPNLSELRLIHNCLTGQGSTSEDKPPPTNLADKITEGRSLCEDLTNQLPVVLVTLGKDGVLLCHRLADDENLPRTGKEIQLSDTMTAVHYPACVLSEKDMVSVSGAGDCLVAALISGMLNGHSLDLCIRSGLLAAVTSIRSYHAVPPELSSNQINQELVKNQVIQSSVLTQ